MANARATIRALAIVLPALLAFGGCARTVEPVEFLCIYRRTAPSMQPESGYHATYTGKDETYHYLNVRTSNVNRGAALLLWGPFRDETLRCRREHLPENFPEGFETLVEEAIGLDKPLSHTESRPETERYVRRYLRQLSAPLPPPGY